MSLEDLLIDGSQAAAGGIRFNAVIGVNAGPDMFVVNVTQTGVSMEGGHEVVLHDSWIGACWYTPPGACWLNASALGDTVGVLVNGNDHILQTVIVFAALQGIVVNGAANVLTSVHTWNSQTGSVPDAVGILVTSWQNRLVAPYLDFVPLVLQGAALTSVTNGFFLEEHATIIFRPHPSGYPVQGIYIAGNEFAGGGGNAIAQGTGYTGLQDVTIVGSLSDSASFRARSTVATLTLRNATQPWAFDFTDTLLFDASQPALAIKSVTYSLTSVDGALYTHAALPPVGARVVVTADAPAGARATITMSVDQSDRTGP